MQTYIYDIDGTLTKMIVNPAEAEGGFSTYAFWPLISYHFAKDSQALKIEADQWDCSDKGVGQVFIERSRGMLERGIGCFKEGVGASQVTEYAKTVTKKFVEKKLFAMRQSGI